MDWLGRDFFDRDVVTVARELLGCVLVHGDVHGRIVEVEAYLAAGDEASHVVRGRKMALAALEKGPGTIYVHPMRQYVGVDLVAVGGSVLLRGVEGVAGPGKLCRAMGITPALQGLNVTDERCPLRVERGRVAGVVTGVRVGVTRGMELPLRFRCG